MAQMTVTIGGFTNDDIEYSPTDKIIKPDDTVEFTKLGLDDYNVTISWDSGCPVTVSSSISLNGSNFQPGYRTVGENATNGEYTFTVTFESLNSAPPLTGEEPEEGPSHGGLEVSRDN
jgi:plastocyanin